jgi:hypothetical protein
MLLRVVSFLLLNAVLRDAAALFRWSIRCSNRLIAPLDRPLNKYRDALTVW